MAKMIFAVAMALGMLYSSPVAHSETGGLVTAPIAIDNL